MSEYRGLCPECLEEENYSETLTNGLCLNCYTQIQEEIKLADIEARLNYEDGYGI